MGSQLCLWSAVDWEVALLFVAGSSCLGLSSLEVVQGSFGWDTWAGTGTWALLLHLLVKVALEAAWVRGARNWLCLLMEGVTEPRYKECGSEGSEALRAFCSEYITYTHVCIRVLSLSV